MREGGREMNGLLTWQEDAWSVLPLEFSACSTVDVRHLGAHLFQCLEVVLKDEWGKEEK